MEFSENRRKVLGVAAAFGVGTLLYPYGTPSKAASPYLIPMVMGGVISSVVSVIGSFFIENRRESAAVAAEKRQQQMFFENERKKIMMEHVNWMFGQLPLNERLLLLRDGSFYNALLSERFDELGTTLAVVDGKLHIARGGYGGQLPSDIGLDIASVAIPKTGVTPVPVDISPLEDDRVNTRVKEFLAESEGLTMSQYDNKYTPSTISKMSFARNPTASGSDYAYVASIDRTQRVSNGSKIDTFKVRNAFVPRKVYG